MLPILQPGWMELRVSAERRACVLHVEREREGDDKGEWETVRGMLKAGKVELKINRENKREEDGEGEKENLHLSGQPKATGKQSGDK